MSKYLGIVAERRGFTYGEGFFFGQEMSFPLFASPYRFVKNADFFYVSAHGNTLFVKKPLQVWLYQMALASTT